MEEKTPLERSLVQRILRWLNNQPRCYAQKTHGGKWGQAGKADITGAWQGRRFELEVKRPGNKATKLQLATLEKWQKAGAIVAVVSSLEEVQRVFRDRV